MKSQHLTTRVALSIVPIFLFMTSAGYAINPWAKAVISYSNIADPANAIGEPDNIGSHFIGSGYIALDMGDGEEIPSFSGVTFTLRNLSGFKSRVYVTFSTNLITWSAPQAITQNIGIFFMDYWVLTPKGGPFRYVKIVSHPDVEVDGITNDLPLPVQLVSFSGRLNNGSVKLEWSTATEVNNYGFAVERKTLLSPLDQDRRTLRGGESEAIDGWTEIGFVDGHGTSNISQKYSFVDNKQGHIGTAMYRLKQIDRDGKVEYSPTVYVKMNAKETIVLDQNYPNPFGTATVSGNPTTNICFTLAETQEIELNVYDMTGRLISTLASGLHPAGNYVTPFNSLQLSSGTYLYSLETKNNRIVKQMRLVK